MDPSIPKYGPRCFYFEIAPMDNSTLFNATDDLPEAASRATLKLSLSIAYFILFIVGTIGNG
ncbi:hypothetical protein ANCDUO_04982 [Ancylostoma duodenale]|uniref:Uncharacterized protein n=1 Tax=Ancylostoma duodenale TaxID=51022 RepID=A0A0C2DPW9_9BILA|nr:hypothetical protein ANCDUO_04982 [Ancylostoma duodenale]